MIIVIQKSARLGKLHAEKLVLKHLDSEYFVFLIGSRLGIVFSLISTLSPKWYRKP